MVPPSACDCSPPVLNVASIRMADRLITRFLPAVAVLVALDAPAHADLQLCSRMSYVVQTAIAIEDRAMAATRGWFRIDPGQCRTVLQGDPPGQGLYIHARALAIYGGSPLPQAGHSDFCIAAEN